MMVMLVLVLVLLLVLMLVMLVMQVMLTWGKLLFRIYFTSFSDIFGVREPIFEISYFFGYNLLYVYSNYFQGTISDIV